ncbi:hypothetical protein JQC92_21695 [Shewanella sp. 202IG2-18]|uniref:type II toxin-antitoxin system RelE/ParE family toxin n=1 Tax=Parashewanella hymeniacidonis TaxID=2807618 RepID=UPI001960B1A6|nr:hypothetical protein [Parashewanella hymeniacidonis]MBM7074596.1 hypothetical protein [Parashewanella hymeniacidonis]
MNKILETKSYVKRASKFLKKHPEIIKQYAKVIKLLQLNHAHPSLRLHKLSNGLWSVSINMSYRILLTLKVQEDGTIILVDIGTHDDVY